MKSDAASPADGMPVAIVGGGFSGTMLAAQLARRGIASLLIEKAGRAGEGTAYSTRDPAHLLNVRTGMMSAWPAAPDHFSDWLAARGIAPGGFAQRVRYGDYLREQLAAAVESGLVTLVDGEAVAARRAGAGWKVTLSDGRAVAAGDLALALGNQPPAPLRAGGEIIDEAAIGPNILCDDPWSDAGRAQVARAAASQLPVVIVGTGLTMVDMVLTLAELGHDARVTAVSRRGLDPRGHVAQPGAALDGSSAPTGLMPLWRWLRGRIAEGDDWRAIVDSLRPRSAELWQALTNDEKRRFMRHARPWWDVHRHRIAPDVAALLDTRKSAGKLEVLAGRIAGATAAGDMARLTIATRGGGRIEREAGLLVNCTGPLGAVQATRDPLLRQLLDDGLASPDPLGLGVDADSRDAAAASERLWVMGPLSKARQWEIIAVPDIRGQAEAVAEAIVAARRETTARAGKNLLAE